MAHRDHRTCHDPGFKCRNLKPPSVITAERKPSNFSFEIYDPFSPLSLLPSRNGSSRDILRATRESRNRSREKPRVMLRFTFPCAHKSRMSRIHKFARMDRIERKVSDLTAHIRNANLKFRGKTFLSNISLGAIPRIRLYDCMNPEKTFAVTLASKIKKIFFTLCTYRYKYIPHPINDCICFLHYMILIFTLARSPQIFCKSVNNQ